MTTNFLPRLLKPNREPNQVHKQQHRIKQPGRYIMIELPDEIYVKVMKLARGIDAFGLLISCKNIYKLKDRITYSDQYRSFDFRLSLLCVRTISRLVKHGHVEALRNRKHDAKKYIKYACLSGNSDLINIITCDGIDEKYASDGMVGACIGGHIDIFNKMVELGAKSFNDCLTTICDVKRIDIYKLKYFAEIKSKRVIKKVNDNHIYIIDKLIKLGASDLDVALCSSCFCGHLKIIDKLIELGASNFRGGFWSACSGGHLIILNMMLNLFKISPEDADKGLKLACDYDSMDVVDKLVELGATCFDTGLNISSLNGYVNMVSKMIELGANNFDSALDRACYSGHLEIVKTMVEMGARNFNPAFVSACNRGHVNIVVLLLKLGANDFEEGLEFCHPHHVNEITEIINEYKLMGFLRSMVNELSKL